MDREGLTISFPKWENKFYRDFGAYVRKEIRTLGQPLFIGLAGIQGSGKSTQAKVMKAYLASQFGMTTCIFSIDDFYRNQTERNLLSERIHPLLKTRGVPGTHHIDALHSVLDAFKNGTPGSKVVIPQFDKSIDNPKPESDWKDQTLPVDIVIFEGWCVGASAQDDEKLVSPVNNLERDEDAEGLFRKYVNQQLREQYEPLWQRLDTIVWMQPSQFEMVYTWRKKQESQMTLNPNQSSAKKMDEATLKRFIMHYERISRHMMDTMGDKADWVIELNDDQSPKSVRGPSAHS